MSNEKKRLYHGCSLGYRLRMKFTTQLCGDDFINHEIRIPIKQPGFNSERKGPRFFFFSGLKPSVF